MRPLVRTPPGSNGTPGTPSNQAASRAPARQSFGGYEPHVLDPLSILRKYRWASTPVLVLVVGGVMIDSYSRIPVDRPPSPVLIENPITAVATPSAIARSISVTERQRPALRLAEPSQPSQPSTSKGDTKVIGTVIDSRQVPVSKAKLRLRNLFTGEIQGESESDDMGEFEFAGGDSGTFVVEMVLLDGQVVGLSNAGSLAPYQTLQTVVQLPGRWDRAGGTMTVLRNVATFLGGGGRTTMTAATLRIAAETGVRPVDAGEPVSP